MWKQAKLVRLFAVLMVAAVAISACGGSSDDLPPPPVSPPDGTSPVPCLGPGDAWEPGIEFRQPGECHHVYRRTSRHEPGGVFEITAITTWRVWWDINGVFDNELELQVGTTSTYQVDEIQVLTG